VTWEIAVTGKVRAIIYSCSDEQLIYSRTVSAALTVFFAQNEAENGQYLLKNGPEQSGKRY